MPDATIETRFEALEKLVVSQAAAIEAQQEEIASLKTEKAPKQTPEKKAAPKPFIPEETFKVDKVEYRFLVPAFRERIGGVWKSFIASEVLKDTEMQELLVTQKRFGIIEKVAK